MKRYQASTKLICVTSQKIINFIFNTARSLNLTECEPVCITKTNLVLLFRETVAVYCANYTEHTNNI
jgi:hypothetical protein